MFYGRITDALGNKLVELGPYNFVNVLVEDLMDAAPEWEPEFEMSVWMEEN